MKKKGNKKMPIPRQEVIDNSIPTSLFISDNYVVVYGYTGDAIWGTKIKMCTGSFIKKQRCRDGVINDFPSRYRHLLVPFLFHEVTSLHHPSFQRNYFSTCSTYFFHLGKAPIKMRCMDSNRKGDYRTQVSYPFQSRNRLGSAADLRSPGCARMRACVIQPKSNHTPLHRNARALAISLPAFHPAMPPRLASIGQVRRS